MSIEKLDIIIQKTLPLVYDDSLSYLEFLAKVVAKVNEAVDELNIYLNQDLRSYVEQKLIAWKDDGTLDMIIGDAILNIGSRTYTEQNYVTDSESVTASIDALDTNLNLVDNTVVAHLAETTSHIEDVKKHRNIYLSESPPPPETGVDGDIYLVKGDYKSLTPVIKIGGNTTGIEYQNRNSLYQIIGKILFWQLEVGFCNTQSLTGDITMDGFDVPPSQNRPFPATPISQVDRVTIIEGSQELLYTLIDPVTNLMSFRYNANVGTRYNLKGENVSIVAGQYTVLRGQGFYFID